MAWVIALAKRSYWGKGNKGCQSTFTAYIRRKCALTPLSSHLYPQGARRKAVRVQGRNAPSYTTQAPEFLLDSPCPAETRDRDQTVWRRERDCRAHPCAPPCGFAALTQNRSRRLCRTTDRLSRLRTPLPIIKKAPSGAFLIIGGERGIRTLDTLLTYTHFPGVLLQPLGHLSGYFKHWYCCRLLPLFIPSHAGVLVIRPLRGLTPAGPPSQAPAFSRLRLESTTRTPLRIFQTLALLPVTSSCHPGAGQRITGLTSAED